LIGAVATARDALLSRQGHDVRAQGLFGLPEIRVVVGDHIHVSALRALSLSGLGEERVERVPVDDQGRMRADLLPPLDETTLVLCQAGNVNSGGFDPVGEVCERAEGSGAWIHVDGAFGLWAGASRNTHHLYEGIERADSWSTDAHKTLNVPYDSGLLLVRDGTALRSTLLAQAAYLTAGDRDGMSHTLEMSRRARVVELWAVLKTLGRSGVEDLIDRLCLHARAFADELAEHGFEIRNDVVFNQVLVACESGAVTEQTLTELQSSGECWCGGGSWFGDPVIRVSVCSWATDEDDVSRSVRAFVAARETAREASRGESE
jgi:glutamate/tyrosine decarboxylase-like PLP-dependent enzyme